MIYIYCMSRIMHVSMVSNVMYNVRIGHVHLIWQLYVFVCMYVCDSNYDIKCMSVNEPMNWPLTFSNFSSAHPLHFIYKYLSAALVYGSNTERHKQEGNRMVCMIFVYINVYWFQLHNDDAAECVRNRRLLA